MIHRGLLFWSVAAVATAVGLFTVKYKVQDLEEKIDRTNQKIIESQQATHILQVEWAHLNEAERIERLARSISSSSRPRSNRSSGSNSPEDRTRPPAARSTTPFPPTNGQRRPLVDFARWWSRRSGGRQPLAGLRTPSRAFDRTHDAPSTGLDPRAGNSGSGWRRPESPQPRSTKSSRETKGVVGEAAAQIWLARTGRRGNTRRPARVTGRYRSASRAMRRRRPASASSSPRRSSP